MSTTKKIRARTKYKVTEDDYNRVKDFQKFGVKATKAASLLPYSYAVLNRIYRFDTWTQYQDFLAEQRTKYAAPKVVAEPVAQKFEAKWGEPTKPTKPLLTTSEVQLGRIANALERLADAWEASPKKKFF